MIPEPIKPCTFTRADLWGRRRRRFMRLRVALLRVRLTWRTWRNSHAWVELAVGWTAVALLAWFGA